MTRTAPFGGILLQLLYPNGKTTHVYLYEVYQPATQWRLQQMASAWGGVPIVCEPTKSAQEAAACAA